MATGAGAGAGERMPPGLEAEADTSTSTDSAVNSGNTNVVTPPPCSIPPGLMPPEETVETALTWLRRTEVALASAAAPPPEPEEFVRGREFRDVCVEDYWSGGGAGVGGAAAGGGAAGRALARHERAERARKRRRGVAGEAGGGGNVNGEDEEEEDDDSSSSSSSMSVLASILASVWRGCGVSFVDLALLHSHASPNAAQTSSAVASLSASSQRGREQQRQQPQKGCPVVEVRGTAGTGKTTLITTMAANYVANTAVGCYLDVDDEDDDDAWAGYGLGVAPTASSANSSSVNSADSSASSTNTKKRKESTSSTSAATARVASTSNAATPPAVVILDSDLDVHPTALVAAVRSAVLRRWGETGAARRLLEERRRKKRRRDGDDDDANEEKREDTTNDATSSTRTATDERNEEWRRIQSTIRDALGRIHVVRTASGQGLFSDGIPALESLRRSLDLASASAATAAGGSASASSAAPPTLLLIDSLTSSDRRDQRLEAVGTGLSGRNEFYRQLRRLRAAHPVAVVATATGAASTVVTGAGTDVVTPWSKMVTARVGLERRESAAAAGEKSGGYEYKALVPCAAGNAATPASGAGGGSFVATVPFKIDSSGIWD